MTQFTVRGHLIICPLCNVAFYLNDLPLHSHLRMHIRQRELTKEQAAEMRQSLFRRKNYQKGEHNAEGITAHARSIQHTDTRVNLEREAGKILDYTLK